MKRLTNKTFRGSWAGLPVAWNAKNQFDEKTYRGDVARCCRLGVPGVYTGGTTGEFYAMEFDEFKQVAHATVEEAHRAGKPAMIGVSSTYTLGACRRAAFAAEIGADAVQVALPFWMEVPDTEVLGFFKQVSAAAGHIPLSVYETLRTKKAITIQQHRAIKKALPNYLMVKSNEATVGLTEKGCAALTKMGVNVFAGEGRAWLKLGPHGAIGCCSSFVYYVPDIVLPLDRLLAEGDWKNLAVGTEKLERLLKFVLKAYAPRGYLDSAIDRLGGIAGGVLRTSPYCRGPYPHGTKEDVAALRKWYRVNLPEVYAGIEAKLALP